MDDQVAFYDGLVEENLVRAGEALLHAAYLLTDDMADETSLFVEIDTFVLACSKLTEIFWRTDPARPFTAVRAERLRAAYGLGGRLFGGVEKVRNRIEHAIEDMDEIVSNRRTVAAHTVRVPTLEQHTYVGDLSLPDLVAKRQCLRCLTTSDLTYFQRGVSVSLPKLARDLLTVMEATLTNRPAGQKVIAQLLTSLRPLFPAAGRHAVQVAEVEVFTNMPVFAPGHFNLAK